MKIKENERNNYDEKFIINNLMKDINRITEDIKEHKVIHNSTIKSAEILLSNLKFYKERILE